ncbi:MAG: FkbM family methyltransferase [Moorea sp. SIO1F2]|uniref:FkbM family methyltransferase n=1 Tax=Moorena sp. SIO1F2 TaxID=2607819 RepID=UPI0013B68275|nr:FkbM family methyltransferase [Moorena sp. SIO1F2]NET84254.1 FkbM family methyltransferase [Moorena sp. SIO1F2]
MASVKQEISRLVNRLLASMNLKLLRLSDYKQIVEASPDPGRDIWRWVRETYSIKTVIDIGANNGDFAEFLACYFNAKQTYVFEPLPSYLSDLEGKAAKIPNLKIFNVALSDYEGEELFYENSYGPASSMLRISELCKKEFPQTSGESEIKVKVCPLDDLLQSELESDQLERDVFIKIDVQGVEDKVIKGGKKLFSLGRCVLVEMSFVPLYKEQPLFEEVHDCLVELGYRFAGIKNQINSIKSGQPLFCHCLYVR